MNNGSKEPQEQDDYSTSSSTKTDWFWASVEVHIKIFENESNPVEVHKMPRGGTKNRIIK